MITERNESGTYTSRQRLIRNGRVAVVICESETIGGAMGGVFKEMQRIKAESDYSIPDDDNPFIEQEVVA